MSDRRWVTARIRLIGGAFLAGFVLGGGGSLAGRLWYPPAVVSTELFAIGALVFGGGLLGWAGSILLGRSVETIQTHLQSSSDWTEASSRRAMGRIAGFGGGLMGGVTSVGLLLGA